ncbi:MAG: hypothetical protein LBU07_06545 [Coriobacteriales bacterium]|jgi:hypothetical protein|nr:hypothetical protein [Coriobacteriales bacterium]
MQYQEIYDEYTVLLNERSTSARAIARLKSGYISTKTISGKQYSYLQNRANGKLLSAYIPADALPQVCVELEERKQREHKIADADKQLDRLEAAAGILDKTLRDKLVVLRRCAAVDALPIEKRAKSIAFGNAINALEGIPVNESVKRNMNLWENGSFSFLDSYLSTLRKHHLMEV